MSRRLLFALALSLVVASSSVVLWAAVDEPAPAANAPLVGHTLFFTLKEPSEENKAQLVADAKKYLSQHPGMVFFAVGPRDEKLSGFLADKEFDVAVHMVFSGPDAFSAYAKSSDHQKFITTTMSRFKRVRMFESAIERVENQLAGG